MKEAVITNRSNQHAPFGDLSHYPTLTRAQETALSERNRAGRQAEAQLASALKSQEVISARDLTALKRTVADGKGAREEFVACNLKLVISMVNKTNLIDPELRPDLYQEAAMGVQTAVEKFDPTKGFKFSTYATWWIKQAISRFLQKNSRTITLPEDVDAEVRRLYYCGLDFYGDHGREATEPEFSELMGLPIERIRKLRQWSKGSDSLDRLAGDDEGDGRPIGDIYVDDAAEDFTVKIDSRVRAELVAKELAESATLSPDDVEILTMRAGLNGTPTMTLEEIADRLGCSREKVRWRESVARRAAQNNPQLRRAAGKECDESLGSPSNRRVAPLVF